MISKWLCARTLAGVRTVLTGEAGREQQVGKVLCSPAGCLILEAMDKLSTAVWLHRYEIAALIRTRSGLLWNSTQNTFYTHILIVFPPMCDIRGAEFVGRHVKCTIWYWAGHRTPVTEQAPLRPASANHLQYLGIQPSHLPKFPQVDLLRPAAWTGTSTEVPDNDFAVA